MSEKRVRELVQCLAWQPSETTGDIECARCSNFDFEGHDQDCSIRATLAKPPDVVAVAKELRRAMNWAKRVESAGRNEVDPTQRIVGQVSALEDERLLNWIQDTFGFRLTENGWEWIETEKQDGDTTRSSQGGPKGRTD